MKIKYCIIMFMLLSLPLCNAQIHINPENAEEDDSFTYKYFKDILDESTNILNEIVFDNIRYLNDSDALFKKMEKTRNEIIIYKSNNIESKSEYIINPFYDFSKELRQLCELNYKLEKDLSKNTTSRLNDAKLKLIEINETLCDIENLLSKIENISILKKGNKTLRFDISKVRKALKLYKEKFLRYENITNTNVSNLSIDVSNKNPMLFENITIYGLGKNRVVVLHIANKSYNLTVKNNVFLMRYSFNKTGIYNIYATQNNISSNVVYVNVSRIPSYIIVGSNYSFYVGDKGEIKGKLIDYYGKPIKNSIIYANNNSIYVDEYGAFNITVFSQMAITKQIHLKYNGNVIYKPCNKTINVKFIKKPVKIIIYTEKNNVSVNEPLTVYGTIYGLNESSNIYIFINNSLYRVIKAKNNFKINVTFNSSGNYIIYAVYKGDNAHESCKSNVINVYVVGGSIVVWVILAITGLILVAFGIYKFKRKVKIQAEEKKEYINEDYVEEHLENVNKENEEIPDEISEAYKYIFNKLVTTYNLPKNLTPRELLNIMKEKNSEIYDDLKFITQIHEYYVYRGYKFDQNVVKEFFKKIHKILREING